MELKAGPTVGWTRRLTTMVHPSNPILEALNRNCLQNDTTKTSPQQTQSLTYSTSNPSGILAFHLTNFRNTMLFCRLADHPLQVPLPSSIPSLLTQSGITQSFSRSFQHPPSLLRLSPTTRHRVRSTCAELSTSRTPSTNSDNCASKSCRRAFSHFKSLSMFFSYSSRSIRLNAIFKKNERSTQEK